MLRAISFASWTKFTLSFVLILVLTATVIQLSFAGYCRKRCICRANNGTTLQDFAPLLVQAVACDFLSDDGAELCHGLGRLLGDNRHFDHSRWGWDIRCDQKRAAKLDGRCKHGTNRHIARPLSTRVWPGSPRPRWFDANLGPGEHSAMAQRSREIVYAVRSRAAEG